MSNYWHTCVSSVIEIPLSLQCKIVQYKFLWQYHVKFQDLFSLCQVQQPAWLQLDHRKLGPSKMRFFRPLYHRTEKHAHKCDIMLWKTFIRVSIDFYTYQEWAEIYFTIYQSLRLFVQGEINKVLHESGVEDRHLLACFENNCVADGSFERVGSQNFFRNRQISSETPEIFSRRF